MNLEELITSFRAQGFDYLNTAECAQFLNDAYLSDICEQEDWPFLEASKEGPAPLAITDLRTIESVINSTQDLKLLPLDRRHITDDWGADLTTEGSPSFYYLTGGMTINVYPANTTDTLLVRYWKAPAVLTSADTPLLPLRFHSLIVDAAKARAYENSDDYELSQNAWTNFQSRLETMRVSLMVQQHDGPDDFISVSDADYYL